MLSRRSIAKAISSLPTRPVTSRGVGSCVIEVHTKLEADLQHVANAVDSSDGITKPEFDKLVRGINIKKDSKARVVITTSNLKRALNVRYIYAATQRHIHDWCGARVEYLVNHYNDTNNTSDDNDDSVSDSDNEQHQHDDLFLYILTNERLSDAKKIHTHLQTLGIAPKDQYFVVDALLAKQILRDET